MGSAGRNLVAPVAAAAATTTAVAAATTSAAATTTTVAAATTATAAAVATTAGAGSGLKAVAAVDRAVTAGLEGDTSVLATGGTGDGEHLAGASAPTETTTTAAACVAACTAAVRAPARFIGEPLGCVEFLFTSGECEGGPAIAAGKRFVEISQLDDLRNELDPVGRSSTSGNEALLRKTMERGTVSSVARPGPRNQQLLARLTACSPPRR
jgi:hypothetical protein